MKRAAERIGDATGARVVKAFNTIGTVHVGRFAGAGCTMLAGGPGILVAEAIASTLDGPLLVNGAVVITDGEARLCFALAESFPPQCGGEAMPIVGLDLATLDLQRADNARWTASRVQLLGFVRDGVVVIDDAALAADGGAQPLLGDES